MRVSFAVAAFAVCSTTLSLQAGAQDRAATNGAKPDPITAEGYITPPEAITRLVTAPREANASFTTPNPGSRRFFVRTVSDGLPSLELVGKAHYNLGGLQIDQRANRERAMTM